MIILFHFAFIVVSKSNLYFVDKTDYFYVRISSARNKMVQAVAHIPIVKKRVKKFKRHQSDRYKKVDVSFVAELGIRANRDASCYFL